MNGVRREQPPVPTDGSIYSAEAVQDVAASMGLPNLPEELLQRLAKDVEYRIHQVVEEAARFTRHGKRTTMSTNDIDLAFQSLNIEPLYGHLSHVPTVFRKANPNPAGTNSKVAAPVYFVEDEEIDFDKVLRDEKVVLPKLVNWQAHWLAVEGIQPLIAENPPKPPLSEQKGRKQSPPRSVLAPVAPLQAGGPNRKYKPVKHVLSRELQIYYSRLTGALLPTTSVADDGQQNARRAAALASLQYDAGLQNLLPYLVRWVGQNVVTAIRNSDERERGPKASETGETLEILLKVIHALIQNERLFIEPYLHQILPPLLSILLTSSLPSTPSTLRRDASEILAYLSLQHGTTYPSLSERLTKTLLLALLAPSKHLDAAAINASANNAMMVDSEGAPIETSNEAAENKEKYEFFEGRMHGSSGSREGAVRGLASLSPQAVERGLIESAGAKIIGQEALSGEDGEVLAVLDALTELKPRSKVPVPLEEMDGDIKHALEETFGPRFARLIGRDAAWAKALLNRGSD
ncbi:hypothetical protein FRC17_005256 [Serendipita sp. 399]|nr:hypothetical protein FRC17_005256 [Serendipita sp. 399]